MSAPLPPLGRDLRLGAALGVLLTLAYVLTPGQDGGKIGGDGWNYFAVARSVVLDLDLDITDDLAELGFSPQLVVRGRVVSTYSVGHGLLLVPMTFVASFLAPELRTAEIAKVPGRVVGYTAVLLALGMTLLTVRALRRAFSERVSWAAAVATLVGTPALFYTLFHPGYSQIASGFAGAAVVLLALRWRERPTLGRAALAGAAVGFAALCRTQDLGFAVVPTVVGLAAWRGGRMRLRELVTGLPVAGVVAAAVFAIQLALMVPYVGLDISKALGDHYMQYRAPALAEVLFSSRNGLFPWSPVIWLGVFGVASAVRRDRGLGLAVLAIVAFELYVNASCWDWWAGWSFGARRFVSVSAGFAFLLAGGLAALAERGRRAARVGAVGASFAAVVALGLALNEGTSGGEKWVNRDMPRAYANALAGFALGFGGGRAEARRGLAEPLARGLGAVFGLVGNPASFPMPLWMRARHGTPIARFDQDFGRFVLFRDYRAPYPYSEGHAFTNAVMPSARSSGYDFASGELRGERAEVLVPLFIPESLAVSIGVEAPSEARGRRLGVRWNGAEKAAWVVELAQGYKVEFQVPAAETRRGPNQLELAVSSPGAGPPLRVTTLQLTALAPR